MLSSSLCDTIPRCRIDRGPDNYPAPCLPTSLDFFRLATVECRWRGSSSIEDYFDLNVSFAELVEWQEVTP